MGQVRRRQFLITAGVLLAAPLRVLAQPERRFRIGCLRVTDELTAKPFRDVFLAGMRELGYVVGRNLVVDDRYAHGNYSRLPALAVALKPDVLMGIEVAASALRGRTTTIPIVLLASANPVAAGLVQSLARPGTNVTGLAHRIDELLAKHIEILEEIRPSMSRVGLLTAGTVPGDPAARTAAYLEQTAKRVTSAKGLTLAMVSARDAEGVRQAFAQLERERVEGVVIAAGPLALLLQHAIIGELRRLRIPSITSSSAQWVEAGGLATYGPNFLEGNRYAATYVARILKGAKPADMPVEQPPKFEFLVNLKIAREIGVSIPRSVLLRTDRVIQ
jgi:putative tryptophan/tyrosine transport system substrate-binding protein